MTDRQWAGRTALVTGALGFIGSHFVEQLAARGATVLALHRGERPGIKEELAALPGSERIRFVAVDLCDANETRAAFKYLAPSIDTVVHCAGLDGNARFKHEHSADILDSNQRITSNLLNCVRDFGAGETVVMSSSEVYCAPLTSATSEDDDYRAHMRYTDNGYVLSKTYAEILAGLHRRQFGTDVFLVRPANVYGPRDSFDTSRGRVIPSMLAKAEAGEEIEIWGDGSQTRSFVHVADLVRASLCMVETARHRVLNIGTTEETAILDLARMVTAALGRPERIRTVPSRPVGVTGRRLDLSRMFEVIDFEPRTLRAGLEETIRWYRRHQQQHQTTR
ncbi:NAD(P)-dependent oxidoreductase [Streptomyces sp. UNOB3_S3]|uniref:NAD-dependent epimerase/dehydratase family protein n=1 Tax=Streptomyces sp. UNOB3_S3 TaxID=2871682 RepID=UPI001E42490F|nr:NAD(P)-dependent oxidoreductase [Streptomyces sp. UNOB3_S3]MCC3776682.1 NAD(P)-dependent oxidoreductase [Streptomyces sp. UNOB3_S3]